MQGVMNKKHKSNEQQKDTWHPAKSVMAQVEFQLYPNGKVDEFMDLFRATKAHLEPAVEMANVRFYAANYMIMGWLQRFATPVLHAPPVRDNDDFFYDDLPRLLDNIEEVD